MKVIEHLDKANNPLFSYEIIPPLRGNTIRELMKIVDQLKPYDPPFIDVTSHSAEICYEKDSDGVMSDEEVANFVQHYQRITEHALRQLPKKSDTVFYLDETRTITKQDVKQ